MYARRPRPWLANSAATKAGFSKAELFETMLCNGEVSHRVKGLACEAIDAIGAHEAARIIGAAMAEGDSDD